MFLNASKTVFLLIFLYLLLFIMTNNRSTSNGWILFLIVLHLIFGDFDSCLSFFFQENGLHIHSRFLFVLSYSSFSSSSTLKIFSLHIQRSTRTLTHSLWLGNRERHCFPYTLTKPVPGAKDTHTRHTHTFSLYEHTVHSLFDSRSRRYPEKKAHLLYHSHTRVSCIYPMHTLPLSFSCLEASSNSVLACRFKSVLVCVKHQRREERERGETTVEKERKTEIPFPFLFVIFSFFCLFDQRQLSTVLRQKKKKNIELKTMLSFRS